MMQSTTKFLSAAAIVVFGVTVLDHLNAQSGETQIASVSGATASPTDETDRAANPLRKLRLKQFSAISERPLFSPDRKPLPKSTKRKRRKPAGGNAKRKTPKRRARVDHLALVGVLKDGPASIAMILNRKTGRNKKVRLDDLVEGWEVAAIDAMKIEMVRGDQLVVLELYQR